MDFLEIKVGPVTVKLLEDDRICQHIKSGKTFEPHTLAAWADMCIPGTEVIDVGAYSGLFSIAAAKIGAIPTAIEALPQMQEQLAKNMKLNEVSFNVIKAAASDKDGTARLGYNERVHLTAGASLLRKSGPGHIVNLVRLDDIDVKNVSAIKIDVERLEANVLRGAKTLLALWKPMLIVEFLDESAKDLISLTIPDYDIVSVLDVRNLIMVPSVKSDKFVG